MDYKFPEKAKFLFSPMRNKGLRGGRGSGKSHSVARALLVIGTMRPVRILCTREIQKSIAQSVHQLLKDCIDDLRLGHHYEVQTTTIIGKNGTQFFFAGLSDQTALSLKSYEGVDIVWCEEASTITSASWKILIPTIRKDGSEIWATYNPELESDATHQRYVVNPAPDTICVEMNHSDNPWFPKVLEAERVHALATMHIDDYNHVWEGRCKPAVTGAIYFQEIGDAEKDGRICNVPMDPRLQTHTVWDLGWNDKMSILLVQKNVSEIRVVKYIEDSHRKLSDYVLDLKAMKGVQWGEDWLPHDGFNKDFKTGTTAEAILKDMGRDVHPGGVLNTNIETGIKALRQCFSRMYIDKEGCGLWIERMRRYRRHINKQTQEAGAPLHDENSHGADVGRYLALSEEHMTNTVTMPPPMPYRRRTVA